MQFVLFYIGAGLFLLLGFYVGRRMQPLEDTDAYRFGYMAGRSDSYDAGLADGYQDGVAVGFKEGEQFGRERQEAETLREVGAVEVPFTTDAEN